MLTKRSSLLIFVLFGFGFLTFYLSYGLLFDEFGVRETQGNWVPIVVWGNLIASVLYIASGVTHWLRLASTKTILIIAFGVLILAGFGFLIHVVQGGLFELKTVGALAFRMIVNALFIWAISRLEVKTAN